MVAKKDETIANLNVWLGKKNKVEAVVDKDIYLTIPKRKKKIVCVGSEIRIWAEAHNGKIISKAIPNEVKKVFNKYLIKEKDI